MKIELKRRYSKSGLFLMELMIAILFFSLASAICIRLFAWAHLTSVSSSELSMATVTAQTAAECFKSADGSAEKLTQLLDGAQPAGNGVAVYYDRDWAPASESLAAYRLNVVLIEGNPVIARIDVEKMGGETVFSLEVGEYLENEEYYPLGA